MPQTPTICGTFVDLRPLAIGDAELTLGWRQAHRARFLNAGAATVEQQAEWIASRPSSEFNFIIARKDRLPLGMLSLTGIDTANRHGEPGRFLIGDEDSAKGIPAAVEAMKLLYGLAFDQLGLVRVFGIVAATNTRMIKWQKYMGMREEGRLRAHLRIGGEFQDAVVLGLLDHEYRGTALPRMNVLISAAVKS